jgi:hypothetical protein
MQLESTLVCALALTLIASGCVSSRDGRPPSGSTNERACPSESRCLRECDDRNASSCIELGDMLLDDDRADEAADAYLRGCHIGDTASCAAAVRTLRLVGREGEGESIIRELCAADQEHDLCRVLTEMVQRRGEEQETAEMHRRRCSAGDTMACREYGRALHLHGRSEDALPLLEESCDAGDLEACLSAAEVFALLGRDREAEEARRQARNLGAEE